MELNKASSTSKLYFWKKSCQQAKPAPLAHISFKGPKKDDSLPNVVDDNINDLAPFCTPDHKIQCNEHWKQKLLELRKIAPSAAVLTSTYHAENSVYNSEETETADKEENSCIPEPQVYLNHKQSIWTKKNCTTILKKL